MQAKHVLITGGTGFIGSKVCAQLLEQGCQLTILTRDPVRSEAILPAGIRLINDLTPLARLQPIDGIVNLAGAPLADRRWTEKRKAMFYSSRVGLTENLFEYFSQDQVPVPDVLVSGSAVGYYGPRGDEPIDESAGPGNCYSSELCSAWESMATRFENLGTRVCRIRTGIVLGQDGGALKSMLPVYRSFVGGRIGSGEQWMSWIHIDDMVSIILLALGNDKMEGPINGTAPQPVRNRDFAKTLGKVLSRPAVLPMPAFATKWLFGEMAKELLLTGQKVVPAKLTEQAFSFRYSELDPALNSIFVGD